MLVQYVDTNRNSKEESVRSNFKKLLIWITDNKDKAKVLFLNLFKNKHYLYDDEEIASNIKQAETLSVLMDKYNIDSMDKLEQIIENKTNIQQNVNATSKEDITEDVLIQYAIDSDEALAKAFLNKDFAERYIRKTKHDTATYEYVKKNLARAKKNIFSYLESQEEYNLCVNSCE